MAIYKNAVSLSLAALIAFGVSGCEGSFSIGGESKPGQTQDNQAPTPSEKAKEVANNKTAEVRQNAEETLNELKAFARGDAFKEFYEEMATVKDDDPDAMAKFEAILDKHKPLQDELEQKIGLTPEALRGYQGIFAMSSAGTGEKYSEKFINAGIYFSALGDIVGTQGLDAKEPVFGVTSNAITEVDGEFKLNSYGIFLKDSNNAILDFTSSAFTSYGLENDGKKIIIENVDGETREDHSSTEQLEIDVKNAATTIETWNVYQRGEDVPLVVENGRITSGKIDKGDPEFRISDGIKLEFEGSSNGYIVTGTAEKTGETITYDSLKGGMQENKNPPSKEEKNSVKYDAKAFNKVKEISQKENSKDLKQLVDYLNSSDYASDAKFEVIKKNEVDYIKVIDPDTKILEKEVLYVSPLG